MSLVIRLVRPDDAVHFVDLRRRVTPYRVTTPAAVRHWWQSAADASGLLVLAAELDGEIVGTGHASLDTWTSERGASSGFVMVEPARRGRGIGGALYEALLEHLRDRGAERVQGWAVDDPESVAWCGRRGLTHTRDLRFSRLDLTDIDALPEAPPMPDGATIASWAEVGPVGVHHVTAAATADEPNDIAVDAMPYGEWLADIWQAPETDLDASTVVLLDGAPVAYTLIEADHGSYRVWSGGTGTLREHRGRGLARMAKSAALRRAAAGGVTVAYTSNDAANRPMLAVNNWLGYEACGTELLYSRQI
ncbi:GNAT family N-acetyltransferase [Kribbella pittospori]|uniref:GNAT family N-acetyltransferase n=1 Tax=Kribbella pittospori TaxID=722689 RepID=A0A4R0JZG3_9ACTN|nr:GNAT family N-acetyltransferase [Kribbella pittospori]TCC52107.1 GNAT family N-acetyltransferase [Kribbella pittospori]